MTLIASMLRLDRTDITALKITDPYSLHRVVYSLFPRTRARDKEALSMPSGILYCDKGGDRRSRRVLLLSDRHPSAVIDGQYGSILSKEVSNEFLGYDTYDFSVIVNPTRRNTYSRKLVPVKGNEEIRTWFSERAERSWGFRVHLASFQIQEKKVLQFLAKNERRATIFQASLSGRLEVTQRDVFKQSFARGLGRARAFGCGLLELKPQ
jgi:CRISPR system Cascade subunit CasE